MPGENDPIGKAVLAVIATVRFLGRFVKQFVSFIFLPGYAARKVFSESGNPKHRVLEAASHCVVLAALFVLLQRLGARESNGPNLSDWESILLQDVTTCFFLTIPLMLFIIPSTHYAARWLSPSAGKRDEFQAVLLYTCATQAVLLITIYIIDAYAEIFIVGFAVSSRPHVERTGLFVTVVILGVCYLFFYPLMVWRSVIKSESNETGVPPAIRKYKLLRGRRTIRVFGICTLVSTGYCLIGHETVHVWNAIAPAGVSIGAQQNSGVNINGHKLVCTFLVVVNNARNKPFEFLPGQLNVWMATSKGKLPLTGEVIRVRLLSSGSEAKGTQEVPTRASISYLVDASVALSELGVSEQTWNGFRYYARVELTEVRYDSSPDIVVTYPAIKSREFALMTNPLWWATHQ